MESSVKALPFGGFWVLCKKVTERNLVYWSSGLNGWIPEATMVDTTLWANPEAAIIYLERNEDRVLGAAMMNHGRFRTVSSDSQPNYHGTHGYPRR